MYEKAASDKCLTNYFKSAKLKSCFVEANQIHKVEY